MIKKNLASTMALLCAVGLTIGSCKKDSAILSEASSANLTAQALAATGNISMAGLSPGFTLGINGHPLGDAAYLSVSAADQINLIKKMGMGIYRINVMSTSDGTVTVPERLQPLLDAAVAADITLLPMLYTSTLDFDDTEAIAYTKGNNVGGNFAAKYASVFKYYDMGNDLDIGIINDGKDGRVAEDYDQKKLLITASYLKGMNDGIHANDPDAQTMMSSSWVHWGFIKFCENYGVNFNILAYHWYSDMEVEIQNSNNLNITDITLTLNDLFPGKPIWITEVNLRPGNMSVFEADQNSFLTSFIAKCKANPTVKAFLIYELFDEPYKTGGEEYYGITKWATPFTEWINRPAAKNFIKVATPELITDITTATGAKPKLNNFIAGATYYTDRLYRITKKTPGYLLKNPIIETVNDDKLNTLSSYLSFNLNRASTIYIAYDPRAKKIPTWLQSWTKTTDKVGITDPKVSSLDLYAKEYAAGQVTLGGNLSNSATGAQTHYLVIVKEK
ncbi:hypothetical protein A0256_03260 [Mucilaginibacter sp. PAMC 26640]|nr:hypothetical protein A0256_03260 [Mucilaginibacter sp. PAMC 26640]